MARITPIVEALVAAKATPEMILAAVRAAEDQAVDALEKRREADAVRQARKRSRDVTLRHSDRSLTRGGVAPVEDKTSNLEIEPQLENKKRERALAPVEFEDWYSGYPHKVQRGAAERAFSKARSIASLAELKAGVLRYIASKPADRHWQNPATWLNGKGWLDQPGVVVPMARGSPARPVDDLINSLVSQMDEADASTTTEIEGHSAAPLRLSARQW